MFGRLVYQKCRATVFSVLDLAAKVKSRYGRRSNIPVPWARIGGVSLFLAKRIRTLEPSILILSLPRSGSSWVGEILGSANNAMYLLEPISKSFLASGSGTTIFDVEPARPPEAYQYFADIAFGGLPAFPPSIVRFPQQWNPSYRSHRRLVIKEVNPLAIDWFLRRYRPRVVFLVRHPAAVALSFEKLGWWFSVHSQDSASVSEEGVWQEYGERQGAILRVAWNNLSRYDDYTIILYEDLCAEPLKRFRQLFDFAGLAWEKKIETLIYKKSSYDDKNAPYGTARNSQSMIRAWKNDITREKLEHLKTGYRAFGLPWYEMEDDW